MTIPYQTISLEKKNYYKKNMDVSALFNPGLYKITCLKNNKISIGQSSNGLSRLGKHVNSLENNRHDCLDLQQDFNKFGKKRFVSEALEMNSKYQNEDLRKEKETLLINQIPDNFRYNKPNFTNSFGARAIKVNNEVCYSLNQAVKTLNESRTHLVRKCLNPNIKNYKFVELEVVNVKKYRLRQSQPCVIDGVLYSS
jgi:hypothetical protein